MHTSGGFGVKRMVHVQKITYLMMLWGCFTSTGPGAIVKVKGIMNILAKDQVASVRKLKLGHKWIF